MDLIADVLEIGGVRGVLGARIDAGANWGWWAPRSQRAALHAVTAGTAWLALAGQEPVQLMPGDVVLLPHGDAHVLASDVEAVARTGPDRFEQYEEVATGVVAIGDGPVRTRILCAHYEHDPVVSLHVLQLLPDLVHIRGGSADDRLHDTVRLLGRELAAPLMGSVAILNSLVDVLLVQLLRAQVQAPAPTDGPSWLHVLQDPVVGAAVAAIHADPARSWTVQTLADVVAVSRPTLARHFSHLVGTTPNAYLTRWRMDLAARRLRDTDQTVEQVALSVGYTSAYAFNRAFSRAKALPPGRFRVAARGSVSPAVD